MTIAQLWRRIPVLPRSVVVGVAVAVLGPLPWARLVAANIKHGSNVPWAVPAMALVLALWWQYFARGRGWPAGTGEFRRLSARANPVPDHLWAPALGAGVLGLIGV